MVLLHGSCSSTSTKRHIAQAHHDRFYEKRIQDTLEAFRAKKSESLRQEAVYYEVNTSPVCFRVLNSCKQRKKSSVKVKARFLTLPRSKAAFVAEEAEGAEKNRIAAEKEVKNLRK
jgi:hypothetical protein